MSFWAIGSSYLMRQSPGGERSGGFELYMRPKRGSTGQVEVVPNDWRTDEVLEIPQPFIDAALEGIRSAAAEKKVNLTELDLVLRRFLYNAPDASPLCFRQSGRIALRAAYESLTGRDLP
jgi:hypothetical protein